MVLVERFQLFTLTTYYKIHRRPTIIKKLRTLKHVLIIIQASRIRLTFIFIRQHNNIDEKIIRTAQLYGFS